LGARADKTRVSGNLKWDGARAPQNLAGAREMGRALGVDPERPLIVAGSTGPGEEVQLLEALPAGAQLLLAPRRPERWDKVAQLRPGMPRRSERSDGFREESGASGHDQRPDVFLLDTIGELSTAYLLADVAFIGRSLIPMGGSNPLEAVALGKPTVIGQHYENFAGIVADLQAAGGIAVSPNPMRQVSEWLADPASAEAVARTGLEAVARNEGAGQRTAELVMEQLPLTARPSPSPEAPQREFDEPLPRGGL